MIIIKFSEYNKNVQHIENRLKDMSLAFQLKQEQDIPKVMFEDGNIRLEGLEKNRQRAG
jgi:hypothetical protein